MNTKRDDELALDAAEEIVVYAMNDKQKIYEIVLRAIWSSRKNQPQPSEKNE